MPNFLPSPQVSLSDAPFLGAQGGDQSPLLPVGVGGRFLLGDQPQGLILSCDHSWWVGLSLQWVQLGLGRLKGWNTYPKENLEYRQVACLLDHLGVPLLQHSQANCLVAQGASVVGISLEPAEMLQKPVLEKPSTSLRELENSGLLCQWMQRS